MITARHGANSARTRRIPGACDVCKKRKVKCDSGEKMGRTCTNCVTAGVECTHRYSTRSLGHAKSYITYLEMRLEKMEKVLDRLLPGVDFDLESDMPETESPENNGAISEDEDDQNVDSEISQKLDNPNLTNSGSRLFGTSSTGIQLIKTALDMKSQYIGQSLGNVVNNFNNSRRQEFWTTPPWQRGKIDEEFNMNASTYIYPDGDLFSSLVDLYFKEVNVFFPLLHRPTFERQLAERLHTRHQVFGNIVLLVCALGAKHSDDPRVFTEGAETTRSAGHKWYSQVNPCQYGYVIKPTLHELQFIILLIHFNRSTGNHYGSYIQVGLGLNLALDAGLHRRRPRKDDHFSIEDELWKRAFWILFAYDRLTASTFGRPCMIHEEDYDQDYPIECDDEFWELPNSSRSFRQPSDIPSTVAYFNTFLRLMEIYGQVMRRLYPAKRSTSKFEQIVTELDSAMNKWTDCVPDHLRWDPNRSNMLFLKQSAALFITYYMVQISIHLPFIPYHRNSSSIALPSLAICTNAARSSCCVIEVFKRFNVMSQPFIHPMSFTAAFVLLVNIWNSKRSEATYSPRRELELVRKVLDMLSLSEQRWSSAGRAKDVILELSSFGDVEDGREGAVDSLHARQDSNPSASFNGIYVDPNKSIMYQRRTVPLDLQANVALPLYGDKLGRIPVYESLFAEKPLGDQMLNEIGSDDSLREHVIGLPVKDFSAQDVFSQGTDILQDNEEIVGMWQTAGMDDITGWLPSANIYEWENYFMSVDQQRESVGARYG